MIKFINTHIGYKDRLLFEVKNLTLNSQNVYILIGKNGSGKSTFLRTIINEEKLISGQIILKGENIKGASKKFISQNVSYVPSSFPQAEYLTVLEFIQLGRVPYTNAFGRLSSSDHSAVSQAIESLGLQSLANKFTKEISDGERQLVALAKAIAQETELIILDEPTAFLDYPNKKLVLDKLKEIAVGMNKCILLSSHDIDLSIEANCPFLVLDSNNNSLQEYSPPVEKNFLINAAFKGRVQN